MRRSESAIFLAACAALLVVDSPLLVGAETPGAAEPGAQKRFDTLYGAEVEHVQRTRDAGDDVALARRLLEAAQERGAENPVLTTILCNTAYDLGARHAEGHDTAVEAMDVLIRQVPRSELACRERLVALRQDQYDAQRRSQPVEAGEALIEDLLLAAEAHSEAGDASEAATLCRRASAVARAVRSERASEIKGRSDFFAERGRLRRHIAELHDRLESNPADAATREELVRLVLVELDAPAEAAPLLDASCDEAIRKYVPAVQKGVDGRPELACLALATWYRGLADGASAWAQAAMYRRALAYYRRYLRLKDVPQLDRAAALRARAETEEALAALGPEVVRLRGGGRVGPGRAIDLVAILPSGKHHGWRHEAEGVVLYYVGHRWSQAKFPCVLNGSCRITGSVVWTKGDSRAGFVLPVGRRNVGLTFGRAKGEVSLAHLTDTERFRSKAFGPLALGQPCAFEVTVRVRASLAEVAVTVNGKPCLHWQGPQSAMRRGVGHGNLPPEWFGLVSRHGGRVVFKDLRLRVLTGSAVFRR